MNYFDFIKKNWRFLCFGIVLNFFSSTGQTFYISIFGGEFRRDFNLSEGDFGFIYMIATLFSAGSLIWLGRLIDQMDLRFYTLLICLGSILACFLTSSVTSAFMLTLAFYLLRLMGQGLMNHAAVTSMGRYFTMQRGTAIGIITLGSTLGLAVYPLVGVTLIKLYGWSNSWLILAVIYSIILIPLILWLLKEQKIRHHNYLITRDQKTSSIVSDNHYSVRAMLTEWRFYLMTPTLLASPFLLTGLLFHQVSIVESKNWSISIFASGFIGLATASFLTSLALGPLVDKCRATNLLPFILSPLVLALIVLNYFEAEFFGFIYLILLGICFGMNFTISGAIWPELYGTKNLGAIKSLMKAIMVFASALSPWVFGLFFDAGFGITEISYLSICLIILTAILAKISQNFNRT
ncbi:MAG TPA: MFS transporter [Rhodospirillales bacterium]|nr:MFS transporter [Rhodospirillales bacterium]